MTTSQIRVGIRTSAKRVLTAATGRKTSVRAAGAPTPEADEQAEYDAAPEEHQGHEHGRIEDGELLEQDADPRAQEEAEEPTDERSSRGCPPPEEQADDDDRADDGGSEAGDSDRRT